RVKHGPAGRGDETDQPTHDREGLHGGVLHTVHVRTLRLRSLRHIEESGCAATTSITQVLTPRRKGGAIHSRLHSAMPDRYPVLLHPALFVYPCGGVVVEQHVRRPTTRRVLLRAVSRSFRPAVESDRRGLLSAPRAPAHVPL